MWFHSKSYWYQNAQILLTRILQNRYNLKFFPLRTHSKCYEDSWVEDLNSLFVIKESRLCLPISQYFILTVTFHFISTLELVF